MAFEFLLPDRDWFDADSGHTGETDPAGAGLAGVFLGLQRRAEVDPEDDRDTVELVFEKLETIPWNRTGDRSFDGKAPSETAGFVTTTSLRRYAGTRLAFDNRGRPVKRVSAVKHFPLAKTRSAGS